MARDHLVTIGNTLGSCHKKETPKQPYIKGVCEIEGRVAQWQERVTHIHSHRSLSVLCNPYHPLQVGIITLLDTF